MGGRDYGLCDHEKTSAYFDGYTSSLVMKINGYFSDSDAGSCPQIFNATKFGYIGSEIGGNGVNDLDVKV